MAKPFPARAYVQTYDTVPPSYVGVIRELTTRGVEVITLTTEEFCSNITGHSVALTKNDLVIGDFDWTKHAVKKLGIPMPNPPDYPKCLEPYLHRKVWQSTLGETRTYLTSGKLEPGQQIFVKPATDSKAFSGIIEPRDQMIGALIDGIPGVMKGLSPSLPVHCSEIVRMVSEYRVYVVNSEIRAVCHYAGAKDIPIDMVTIATAVGVLFASEESAQLAGCALDFTVIELPEGRVTGLVEVNDGFSLGRYDGISDKDYTDLLIARWHALCK
eukprot:PhF_6_TR13265/c0_g1_i1/m.21033